MNAAPAPALPIDGRGVLGHIYGLVVGLFALCLVVADNRELIHLLYASFSLVAIVFAVDLAISGGRMAFPLLLRTYALFATYALLSIIWSRAPDIAVTRGTTIMSTAIALPLLAHLLRYPVVLRYALAGLAIALCLLAALLVGAVTFPGEIWSEGGRFQGTFALATNMARALFLVGLVAFLAYVSGSSPRLKSLAAATLVLAFLLAVATFSRAGVAAIGVLVGGLLLLVRPRVSAAIGAGAVALVVVVVWFEAELFTALSSGAVERALPLLTLDVDAGSSADLRRMAIVEAIARFELHPILGGGLASFESFYGYYAHNAWADIAANLGVIGLGFWGFMYVLLLRAVWGCPAKTVRRAGYVAVFALFLLELADAFYLSRTGMLAMLVLYVVMRQASTVNVKAIPQGEI